MSPVVGVDQIVGRHDGVLRPEVLAKVGVLLVVVPPHRHCARQRPAIGLTLVGAEFDGFVLTGAASVGDVIEDRQRHVRGIQIEAGNAGTVIGVPAQSVGAGIRDRDRHVVSAERPIEVVGDAKVADLAVDESALQREPRLDPDTRLVSLSIALRRPGPIARRRPPHRARDRPADSLLGGVASEQDAGLPVHRDRTANGLGWHGRGQVGARIPVGGRIVLENWSVSPIQLNQVRRESSGP